MTTLTKRNWVRIARLHSFWSYINRASGKHVTKSCMPPHLRRNAVFWIHAMCAWLQQSQLKTILTVTAGHLSHYTYTVLTSDCALTPCNHISYTVKYITVHSHTKLQHQSHSWVYFRFRFIPCLRLLENLELLASLKSTLSMRLLLELGSCSFIILYSLSCIVHVSLTMELFCCW